MTRFLSVLLLSSASLAAALLYPYDHPFLSFVAFALALVATFTVAFAIYSDWRLTRRLPIPVVLAVFPAVFAYFVCTTRQSFDDIVPVCFEATVTSLYRSQNHQYPGVELWDASRGTFRMEPVSELSWRKLRVGDQLYKQAMSTVIQRGDERIPVVEPSFFHTVRGGLLMIANTPNPR